MHRNMLLKQKYPQILCEGAQPHFRPVPNGRGISPHTATLLGPCSTSRLDPSFHNSWVRHCLHATLFISENTTATRTGRRRYELKSRHDTSFKSFDNN